MITEWDASAPEAGLAGDAGGRASGGSSTIDATVIGALGFSPLLILGGLCLVGAGVAAYMRLMRAALYAGVAGGALILIGLFPSVVLLGALAAAGVAALVWSDRNGLLKHEALRAVIAGVEAMPDGTREAVKREIGRSHADERDRRVIRKVKAADGYGGER